MERNNTEEKNEVEKKGIQNATLPQFFYLNSVF